MGLARAPARWRGEPPSIERISWCPWTWSTRDKSGPTPLSAAPVWSSEFLVQKGEEGPAPGRTDWDPLGQSQLSAINKYPINVA